MSSSSIVIGLLAISLSEITNPLYEILVNVDLFVFDATPAVILPPYIMEFFIYRLLIFPSRLVNRAFCSSIGSSIYNP
jgi:hypothetical protein